VLAQHGVELFDPTQQGVVSSSSSRSSRNPPQPVLGVLDESGGKVDGDLARPDDQGALAECPRRRTARTAS
jgi:hypothetical protein